MPKKTSKQAGVWWCALVGLGGLLTGKQEDHKLIRRTTTAKKLEESVLPSAFFQENLVLKPRASLTRI